MNWVRSVNIGTARHSAETKAGVTGIDKRPVTSPVWVRDPGPKGTAGSGLADDAVCDLRHHGGSDQAVYAYAAEDLDEWGDKLGRTLAPGVFGENLTTTGIDITGARIGQRWQVGERLLLEVSAPRIPCRTFADWLAEHDWLKTFIAEGKPGAYLRVIEPGPVRPGDPILLRHDPGHAVTIGLAFRALTTSQDLLPLLTAAEALPDEERRRASRAAS